MRGGKQNEMNLELENLGIVDENVLHVSHVVIMTWCIQHLGTRLVSH